jgi:hypothetical protein
MKQHFAKKHQTAGRLTYPTADHVLMPVTQSAVAASAAASLNKYKSHLRPGSAPPVAAPLGLVGIHQLAIVVAVSDVSLLLGPHIK